MIFGLVAYLSPAWMVTILFAAPGVATCGLNVAACQRTNPHVGPGRRYGQRSNALQLLSLASRPAVQPEIAKVFTCPLAPDAGPQVVNVAQPGNFRGLSGIDRNGRLIAGLESSLEERGVKRNLPMGTL
jgi:hypothetical protein